MDTQSAGREMVTSPGFAYDDKEPWMRRPPPPYWVNNGSGRVAQIDADYQRFKPAVSSQLGKGASAIFQELNSQARPSSGTPQAKPNSSMLTEATKEGISTGAGALGGGALAGLGSAAQGITNLISSFHRDNTALAMQNRDYQAARSVGLVSPSQLGAGFSTNRNGRQQQVPFTLGPSPFA